MPRILALACALILLSASTFWAAPLEVFVSIPPQKTFVERIGGEYVTVEVMVSPGASPATYEPRPRQMADLSRAAAYFTVGVPFERAWLGRIAAANPSMRMVHTEAGVERLPIAAHIHEEEEEHGHHDTGHEGEILDPHIWLSPPLVKTQALTIMEALSLLDPANSGHYSAQFELFRGELDTLDRRLREILTPVRGKAFMVFHPSWGYFARTYGLEQVAIEVSGREPSPREMADLIGFARGHGIRTIFVQPQFSRASAESIARAIKARVVEADPLAEEWSDNLLRIAREMREALDEPGDAHGG